MRGREDAIGKVLLRLLRQAIPGYALRPEAPPPGHPAPARPRHLVRLLQRYQGSISFSGITALAFCLSDAYPQTAFVRALDLTSFLSIIYGAAAEPHGGGPLPQPDGSLAKGVCHHFVRMVK